MTGIRIIIGLVVVVIVAVTLIPMLVLLDLAGGGDGWGLCQDGLSSCRTSYFDGPELVGMLLLLLFVLLFVLRLALRALHMAEARQSGGSMSGSDRFGRR